jgi:hypothetical protein
MIKFLSSSLLYLLITGFTYPNMLTDYLFYSYMLIPLFVVGSYHQELLR